MRTARRATRPLAVFATLAALAAGSAAPAGAQAVFLNEIHYDNTGTDAGEAIEVAGPAGTDLTGWTIVLYNGSGGAVYDTDALSGTIDDEGGGFGAVSIAYAVNGIQNGSPDGIALVDAASAVVEFLCYEGTFAAVGGAANGMTCTDIGVSETGSEPVGRSLKRVGTGACGSDFAWQGPTVAADFGALNAGQTMTGSCGVTIADPLINEFVLNHTGTDNFEYVEVYGDPSTDYSSFTLLELEGDFSGTATGVVDEVIALGSTDGDGFWFTGYLVNALENGTLTLLLVENFTGALGNDLDTNDDGTLDAAPWDRIVDAGAVTDGGASDRTYGVPVLAASFDGGAFTVGGASRIPNGTDTDAAADWKRNDFDGAGIPALDPGTPFFGEAYNTPETTNFAVPPAIVINEIHADPHASQGDANGDGTVSTTQDEFVEIVNTTPTPIDVSGWTLSDGFGLRHTFPGGTSIAGDCAIVVFAGGSPFGLFGGATVQTASSGALGLNNDGDALTLADAGAVTQAAASYGAEGGSDQSLTLDPDAIGTSFVLHTTATGAARYSPGTRVDGTPFAGCTIEPVEIFEIQGSGVASPYAGQTVLTEDNIVTTVGTNGFHVQTPDARDDADPTTSNGVFVFTGGPPAVAVGDQVDVVGRVEEFFEHTEIEELSTTVDSAGNPLPAAIVLDAATPSPDPSAPTCGLLDTFEENNFECLEGMRVTLAGGSVGQGNQRFSTDVLAEPKIAAGPRAFREPGVLYPGLGGTIPTFDGNPQVFELDPDRLGLANVEVPGRSTFDATGVIGYDFGDYELWPTSLSVTPAALPIPVRDRAGDEFTIGSLNLFRLFDDVDDPSDLTSQGGVRDDTVVSTAEWDRRRGKFARYIVDVLKAPDVLGVQECESLGVLQALAAEIALVDPGVVYTAYLVEGNDVGTIDNGFLVRDTVSVLAVAQLDKEELFAFDGSLLNDRPMLLLRGEYTGGGPSVPFGVLDLHQRSLGGIDDPVDGPRVRAKRLAQAESVAKRVQEFQETHPFAQLVVVGDFNAYEFTDGYVDVTGTIKGDFDPAANLLAGTDWVDPNLTDQVLAVAPAERYSFVFGGSAQVLDHALTSLFVDPFVRGLEYGRGNADAAFDRINDPASTLRSSDHDGLVLLLESDDDGVPDELDLCPGTEIPEAVPTKRLLQGNWALRTNDGVFDTTKGKGTGVRRTFTVFDTGGCSCDQIIDQLGLGAGHERYGCSTSAMEQWVAYVASL